MSNEKTLVILSPGFPASEGDSVCLPMQQQFVRSLKEIYPQLNIIILSFQYPYFRKKYTYPGVTVISFSGRNKGGLTRLLTRRKLFSALRKINSSSPVTGLLSLWYGECALVGKRFGDKYGIKHYCWILGQDAKKENKYPRRVQANAGELIALSDFLQSEFEKNHGIKPLHVIPPGMNTGPPGFTVTERDIHLMAAGSLIPLKRFDVFLEIVSCIKEHITNVKAVLAGNGPEKERLQQLVTKLGLEANVELPGEIPHPEVLKLMQRTKVFLHPSSYEGFPGVCLEALYSGAHVISFCKPMNRATAHWHILHSKKGMEQKAREILQNPGTVYEGISDYAVKDTVEKMVGLFFEKL